MQRGRLYHDVFSAKWPLSRIPIDVVVEFAAGGTGYVNSLRWQTGLEAMGELAHILVVRHVLQGDQIVHRLHEHRRVNRSQIEWAAGDECVKPL